MNTITKNQHLEAKYPNHSSELLDAIEEAKQLEADPKAKRYTDTNKMWADLDKWAAWSHLRHQVIAPQLVQLLEKFEQLA